MEKRPFVGIPTQSLHAIDGIPEHLPPSWVMSQRYFLAISNLGGVPWMIPLLDADRETLRAIYDGLDGLLLAGGVDVHPDNYGAELGPLTGRTDLPRDMVELQLARWALEDGMPVLGACRGIQAINVAGGGTLYQDVHEERVNAIKHDYFPTQGYARDHLAHDIEIQAGTLLQEIYGGRTARVNSMHHQGIRDLAPGLRVTAFAPDGLVEAVEFGGSQFVLGVQWHPEMLVEKDAGTKRLFLRFLEAAVEFGRRSPRAGRVDRPGLEPAPSPEADRRERRPGSRPGTGFPG